MNITEIVSWLDERYDIESTITEERFIMQTICREDNPFGHFEHQGEQTIDNFTEKGNYIIISDGVTAGIPCSNSIILYNGVDKYALCKELNKHISEKAKVNNRLSQLNQYLLGDNFMEHLLDYFFEQFQNPIMYVDYSHYVISYRQSSSLGIDIWDNAVEYGHYDPHLIDDGFQNLVDAVVKGQAPHCMKLQGFDYYIWAIRDDITLYGFFAMISNKQPMTEDDLHIISTAADLTALKLGNHNYVSGTGDYSEIIMDLMSNKIKAEHELTFRMLTRNWKKPSHYQILLIDLHGKGEKYKNYVINSLKASSYKMKHITYEEYELILLEESSSSQLTKIINYAKQYNLISGLSDVFNSLLEIKAYFEQGKKAIIYGSQFSGEANVPFKYSDYRFYDFLNDCANTIDCSKYYHPITADLELYDVKHKTDLFETLLTYLECGRSIHKTCTKMYLHKNTVNYRIQRIKALFNIDYDDGESALYIYLSLKLHSVNRVNSRGL